MSFGLRLAEFAKTLKISKNALAKTLSVSHTTIGNLYEGKHSPQYNVVESLATCYPELNLRWLLTGEGDMWQQSPAGLPGVVQTAVALGGDASNHHSPDPCAALRVELAASQRENSRLKDKIISLLEGQNKQP